MPKVAFRFEIAPDPFAIEGALSAAVIKTKVAGTIRWVDGSSDAKAKGLLALDYTTSDPPDLTVGCPTILFVIKGSSFLHSTTADHAGDTDMDTLTSGANWGIIGFVDQGPVEPWPQF